MAQVRGRARRAPRGRSQRRAVVDIGSNSVRLVVYEGPLRAPMAICNEKALCGLGRDMSDEGYLNPQAVGDALANIRRFRRLLDEFGDPPIWVFATAAVREAADGAEFVAAVREIGFDTQVISGAEEADLAALGVVSFEPRATGVAGDMGGGSLELAALKEGVVAAIASLPIGPLKIIRATGRDQTKAHAIIASALDEIGFLKPGQFDTLYAVGGAWRAIARLQMRLRDYPLSVLHHYELTSAQGIEVCDLIAQQSRQSLEEIPGIPRRRIDTLPIAAIVLKSVIERMGAKNIVVSAGGVREGLLFRTLTCAERAIDPFVSTCQFFAEKLSPNPACGEMAARFVEPLFVEDEKRAHLRYATALMLDIGAYFHPELRGSHVFGAVLSMPFVGVSHAERVWMALALFSRHEGRSTDFPNKKAIRLLDEDARESAVRFGLALRFAAAFAPKVETPLTGCRLERDDGRLVFHAPSDREALMGETPRRRLESLAAAFNAAPMEIYER